MRTSHGQKGNLNRNSSTWSRLRWVARSLAVMIVTALWASGVYAQAQIALTVGPWYTWTGGSQFICGIGQTPELALQSLVDQANLLRDPALRMSFGNCLPFDWGVGWSATHPLQVPGCSPESYDVQGGHAPDPVGISPRCSVFIGSTFAGYQEFLRHIECPPGYRYDSDDDGDGALRCVVTVDDSCPAGDPVSPLSGNVTETEVDYRSGGAHPLEFIRYYTGTGHYKPGLRNRGERAGGLP